MSFKSRLVTLFCCSVLELAALTGVPMRPDEIRNLMELLRRPKIVHTDPERTSDGDGRMPATRLPMFADTSIASRRG